MGNHVHQQQQQQQQQEQQHEPDDPVTRNGNSKSQQIADTHPNSVCHVNSAYLEDETEAFSEIHQGEKSVPV